MLTDSSEIRIETSTACPYNCTMCPRDRFRRKIEFMSDELFEDIARRALREIPKLKMITVSGFGEFSLDPGWDRKLEIASELYDRVHVVTNLCPLEQKDLDKLLFFADDIRVSIYATTNQVFRKVHNPPDDVNLSDIEQRIKYIADQRRSGQRLIMTFLELEANKYQREKWMQRWSNVADLIEVWLPHNWVDGRSYREVCDHRLPTCGRPFHGPIQVQADGTMNICCFDYNGELQIGDLKKHSFKDIYNGQEMKLIQMLHESGRSDEIPACRVCDQRDCRDCKTRYLVYDSGFDRARRILMTATSYEEISKEPNQ